MRIICFYVCSALYYDKGGVAILRKDFNQNQKFSSGRVFEECVNLCQPYIWPTMDVKSPAESASVRFDRPACTFYCTPFMFSCLFTNMHKFLTFTFQLSLFLITLCLPSTPHCFEAWNLLGSFKAIKKKHNY